MQTQLKLNLKKCTFLSQSSSVTRDGNNVLLVYFLAVPSNCHCSSIKATDPVSTALSSSLYARNNSYSQSFFCLHIKTHTPQRNLAQKCAVNYCLLLREIRICRSIGNISRLHRRQQMGVHRAVMYLQHGARYLAGLNLRAQTLGWCARGGETGLNIPCYRLRLSA